MNDYKNLVNSILIPTSGYLTASNRLEQAFKNSIGASEANGIALIGESRTGKSRLLEEFSRHGRSYRQASGITHSIVLATMPQTPTPANMATAILQALGDPLWGIKESDFNKTSRANDMLMKCKADVLIIDEMQHVIDRGTDLTLYVMTNWIKTCMERRKGLTVLGGLPSTDAFIDHNEQLTGRFDNSCRLERFRWDDVDSRAEFKAVLLAFAKAMNPFSLPDISLNELAFRFYEATGGLMGYVVRVLRQASWDAIDANRFTITLEDLAVAWKTAVRGSNNRINPFSNMFIVADNFVPAPIVGAAVPAPQPKRKRKPMKKVLLDAA